MVLYGYKRASPSSENSRMPKAVIYLVVWRCGIEWKKRCVDILVYLNTSYAHFLLTNILLVGSASRFVCF